MKKLIGLVGSNSDSSTNRQLLKFMASHYGAEADIELLNNALAWLSYGVYPFVNKPVMVVGASYGTLGSSRAQLQILQILEAPELQARTMPSSEFLLSHSLQAFNEDGDLIFEEKVQELNGTFADFMVFIDIIKQLPHSKDALLKAAKNFNWENL